MRSWGYPGDSHKAMLTPLRWNTIFFPLLLTVCSSAILSCYRERNSEGLEALVQPAAGHEHEVKIRLSQVDSGIRTFNLEPTLGHTHNIVLTDEMVQTIKDGGVAELESSLEMYHTHIVRIEKFF
ncbi:MAG TPA: hypothetical protein DEA96_06365 [Leptospiraceae bacterium]|nr:hypothetical protein [Leptospiraceae bacterium]